MNDRRAPRRRTSMSLGVLLLKGSYTPENVEPRSFIAPNTQYSSRNRGWRESNASVVCHADRDERARFCSLSARQSPCPRPRRRLLRNVQTTSYFDAVIVQPPVRAGDDISDGDGDGSGAVYAASSKPKFGCCCGAIPRRWISVDRHRRSLASTLYNVASSISVLDAS